MSANGTAVAPSAGTTNDTPAQPIPARKRARLMNPFSIHAIALRIPSPALLERFRRRVSRVGEMLAKRLRADGARVVLTRSYEHPYRIANDPRVDNRARAALANRLGATAFLALHCDASNDPARRGTSVFWLRPNSIALAENLRRALAPLGLGESEFRRRHLAVTDEARVPAVLVELGFITNPTQQRLLLDPRFEAREVAALERALIATFGERSSL